RTAADRDHYDAGHGHSNPLAERLDGACSASVDQDPKKGTTMNAATRPTDPAVPPAATGARPDTSASRQQRMKAIVQDEYGTADVLRIDQIDRPTIGADEVLIRVHAAGLDRGTW